MRRLKPPDTRQFWQQVEACEFEILPGRGQRLRWGAPRAGQHDDFLISAALVTWLDQADWAPAAEIRIDEVRPVELRPTGMSSLTFELPASSNRCSKGDCPCAGQRLWKNLETPSSVVDLIPSPRL